MQQDQTPVSHDARKKSSALFNVLVAVVEQRKIFLSVLLAGLLCTVLVAFGIKRFYVSSTVVLLPQAQSSTGAALAQLGSLASMAGGGLKPMDEMYVALLKTKRIQDQLIQKFDLKNRYQTETLMATRKRLGELVVVTSEKKAGLITLEVADHDPAFAATLANAYVVQLRTLLGTLAVTDAQQRRLFFQSQVDQARQELDVAERQFRQAQAKSGMVVSQALVESDVRAAVELRAQIAAKEVQIKSASRFVTAANPQLQRLAADLSALKLQLAAQENGQGDAAIASSSLDAVKAYRNLKVREISLETLLKQLEIARVDESRDGPMIQQVDIAQPAERPTKPSRLLVLGLGGLVSLAFSALLVILISRLSPHNWQNNDRLRALRLAWSKR